MHKKLALLTLMNIVMTLSLSGCGSYDNVAACEAWVETMTCGETDFSTLVVLQQCMRQSNATSPITSTASPRTTAATWASRTRRVGQPARPSPFARNNRQTLRISTGSMRRSKVPSPTSP